MKFNKWVLPGTVAMGVAGLVGAALIMAPGSNAATYLPAASVGNYQLKPEVKTQLGATRAFTAKGSPVVISKIGGPITANGTKVPGVDLSGFSGKFLVQIYGQANRTVSATVDEGTQVQLSLWLDRDNDGVFEWKTVADGGNNEGDISPVAGIPTQKDRSVTLYGQSIVQLNKTLHTKLVAFGYNNTTSDGSSGQITMGATTVVLTPIR